MTTASMQELVKSLREQIAQGEIELALGRLQNYLNVGAPALRDEAILLTTRYNRLRREERKGVISRDTAQAEQNRVVEDLLGFVEEVSCGIGAEVPPAGPAPALATAPAPIDHFIGRQTALRDLAKALTSGSSQTTIALLGMGGIGKTALATKAATQLAGAFPGGVFWAELSAHEGDPLPILAAWARLCNQDVSELPDPQTRAQAVRGFLAGHVAERGRLLIILDDVRVDWLDGARVLHSVRPEGIPVLITAREAKVAQALGARSVPLEVLSMDEASALLTILSNNTLSGDKADQVARLCGYLPLALTLAAAIANEEGADWLLDELSNATSHLDVLKLDDPHRKEESMCITLGISYQSLIGRYPETARTFRYLGTFAPTLINPVHLAGILGETEVGRQPGQVEVDAARVRAADEELRCLARWALVRREGLDQDKLAGYSLHPLIHQYARSLLAEAGEASDAGRKHLTYYLAFAQANAQANPSALDRLEEELPNLLLAAKRAAEIKDSAALVSLEEALLHNSGFLDVRGYYREAIDLFSQSLAVQEVRGEQQHQARTLNKLAWFYVRVGQFERAQKHAEQAFDLADALQDQEQQADSHRYLGRAFISMGKQELALEYFKKELDIRYELSDRSRLASCIYNLGTLHLVGGPYAEARQFLDDALNKYGEIDDERGMALCIGSRGTASLYLGDYASATEDFEMALNQSQELGDREGVAHNLLNQGILQSYLGDYSLSIGSLEEALPLWRDDVAGEALTVSTLAEVYGALGDYRQAMEYLQTAGKQVREAEDKEVEVQYLNALGTVQYGQGNYAEALETYSQMEALAEEIKFMYFLVQSKLGLSRTLIAQGSREDLINARQCAWEAFRLCQELQLAGSEPCAHACLGKANLLLGHRETALQSCYDAMRTLDKQEHVHGSEAAIYLAIIQILAANDQEREGQPYLERAYDLIQATADKIENESLRQYYLAAPVNHRILTAWGREDAGCTT